MYDNITNPIHYNWHPSGVEAKEVTDDLPRWLGDAITYIWRRNHKGQPFSDRRKAIERLNEATPERLEALQRLLEPQWSVGNEIAETMEKVKFKPDPLIFDVRVLIVGARMESMTCEGLQRLINQLKDYLQYELDELTANEKPRTPTIYEEQ